MARASPRGDGYAVAGVLDRLAEVGIDTGSSWARESGEMIDSGSQRVVVVSSSTVPVTVGVVQVAEAESTDAQLAPLLVLWDVDHTLIENGGVSKATYRRAFEMVMGSAPVHPVETDGRTDVLIMRSLFERHEIEPTGDLLAQATVALPQALSLLTDRLRVVGYALPGAQAALVALSVEPGLVQSPLTGNVVANAYTKLAAFGLHQYLDLEVGGYGSDAEVRSELVEVARGRAAAKYGLTFTASTTVLIGDTIRDVQAGHDGGAYVIGVASGEASVDELLAEGADAVLADLADTALVVNTVRAVRR